MSAKTFLIALIAMGTGSFFTCCDKGFADSRPDGTLVPKTVSDDTSLPSITVNGARLHAEAHGHPDSALLVVIHGGPGADYRYLLNCTAFADKGFRVVFYDQSGAGLSQRFPKPHYKSVDLLTDELGGVIAHYRKSPAQKVFLLGHSWGAMLATAYVNAHPEAVNGLILAEPGGLVWADVVDYIGRSQNFGIFSEELNDAVFVDQLLTGLVDEHEVLDYKFGLLAASGDAVGSPIGNEGKLTGWRAGAVVSSAYLEIGEKTKPDWTQHLGLFQTKVLFIFSENNRAYGLIHAQKVSSAYPNVELFKTLGAGHDMLSFPTGWDNTFPTMLNYLNDLK